MTGPNSTETDLANASPTIRQGEIWLVACGAGRPGEPTKHRPCVVVSCDFIQTNSSHDLISVVPLSSSRPANVLRPAVKAGSGLDRDSTAVCDAVRAFVRSRFLRRLGALPATEFAQIRQARAAIEGWDAA